MNFALNLNKKRIFLALATLPFLGVVTAFGIAPDTTAQNITQETVIEALALPEAQPTDSGAFDFWREERISRGETLSSLLQKLGINTEDQQGIISAAPHSKAMGNLLPGRSVLARVSSSGRLLLLRYLVSDTTLVSINRINNRFEVAEQTIQPEMRPVMRSGSIQGSLFGATDAADVPDKIASEMAEAFSGDIDFHKDLRSGDHFSVIYEAFYFDGRLVKTGRLLAAEFVNQDKPYQAIYFKDAQGHDGYYNAGGLSLKRAFLKSPMPFDRISSGFSTARLHPVLNIWRSHKGVDYAAPTGTPVRAIADSIVSFAGKQGGYGNLVVLNHQAPYSTAYGHLSRFGNGLKRGAKVKQGQVIGYVGATGLASGPHLHYEFRVNGDQRNPLAMKLPTAYPLDNRSKAAFSTHAQPLTARLTLLRDTNLSRLD
ncbi:MAG: peptidase M23 [Hydrogenophilales bacterium 28-61-23]|nr:MAG: peptidase M23 [Hydrogenophilales bacterium 28-61-23]